MVSAQVVPVVMDIELPAGMAGPEPMTFDVRCFLVPHGGGVTLVDTGMQADAEPIADALTAMGAGWDDLSDVVLTHAHPDHCGALSTVASRAPSAAIWGGNGDTFPVATRPTKDGTLIHGLRVVSTPGHTPGHLCLLDEGEGILFTGDAISSHAGQLSQGPEVFIADAQQAARSLQRLVELRADRMLFGHGDEVAEPADTLASFATS
jgi:glyoxylase-like metal-dependent hydrolase (beta-lactamase superfamily II)